MKYILITILFPIFLFASNSIGDIDKGHTYYKYIINPLIDIRGDEFTTLHTKEEWKNLFSNDAVKFKSKYRHLNKKFEDFLKTEKFKQIAPDLETFFIYYSKDSDIKPQCGD